MKAKAEYGSSTAGYSKKRLDLIRFNLIFFVSFVLLERVCVEDSGI